jgi:hypothetical protein
VGLNDIVLLTVSTVFIVIQIIKKIKQKIAAVIIFRIKPGYSKARQPKDYGIKLQCISSSSYPAPASATDSTFVPHVFIPFPFGLESRRQL